MALGVVTVAPTSFAASPSSCPSQECATLASCALIPIHMQNSLANDSVFILHRTQWQCLAKSYSEVLRTLTHLLPQHPCSLTTLLGRAKPPIVGLTCVTLLRAMQDGERCMEDCTANSSGPIHSWLLDKAVKLGNSTFVVDVHLCRVMWAFSGLFNQGSLQVETLESDLVQLTRALSDIWACQDLEADLSEARSLFDTVKAEYDFEGETSRLADFLLRRVSHAQDLRSVECVDGLPTYLWIDLGSLTKEPEIIGEGAYGKVQVAGWLGGRFAVKDFLYVGNDTEFLREAAIHARLRHPNVLSLVCCTRNPTFEKCSLVLELMHQDLRVCMIKRMKGGTDPPFPLDVAVDLMLQLAQGMEYLHSLHIMHRDLKSSNILVSSPRSNYDAVTQAFPCLKIADFGMAKAKLASSKYTTREVGSTAWRAPEVNPEDDISGGYTKKADVYSFGLVCYEILTGKCPFEGLHQVRKRVLGGERPRLPPFLSPALSSYIERCWHAEPSRRPSFSQICKMLYFFKACMNDYDQQSPAAHHGWLLHPLSLDECARIDNMSAALVQSFSSLPCPRQVTMLLEMYCCRVVLRGNDETVSASDECVSYVKGMTITQEGVEPSMSIQKMHKSRSSYGKSSSEVKSYSIYVPTFVRKLFGTGSVRHSRSGIQDVAGLVRDFSLEELRLATANFSKSIGKGFYSDVYHGTLRDGQDVAVKVYKRDIEVNYKLNNELQIVSQLRHRNIVTLYGWCKDRQRLLVVYEFMSNGSLKDHIFQGQKSLSWQRRYKVIYQLASALKYLHLDSGYSKIVHRDVCPANVLLDSEWNARLGGFGILVLLQNGDAPDTPVAGRVDYICPDIFMGIPISPAADVFSFGITILEIVTGRSDVRNLAGWVQELHKRGDLMQAVDVQLGGEFEEVEMQRVLLLGVLCTRTESVMRPDIERVLQILSQSDHILEPIQAP